MKRYLLIETSTDRGVIAYGSSEEILFHRELPLGFNQSKFLMPTIKESLEPYQPDLNLAAIGAGVGPGSYTGIRIGVAAAQAFAYSWKVPLIGVSSLDGFVPTDPSVAYAAVIDARIGGAFFQKRRALHHGIEDAAKPQVCALEELDSCLEGIRTLVTPNETSLRIKLSKLCAPDRWIWEEKRPSVEALLRVIEAKDVKGEAVSPPEQLTLLYLLQTEAEREKSKRKTGE